MLFLRFLVRLIRYGATDGQTARPGVSHIDSTEDESRKKLLQAMLDGACGLVQAFHVMNRRGLWLTRDDAGKFCRGFDIFAASYSFLALKLHEQGLCRFHLEPSLHLLKHMSLRVKTLLNKEGCKRILSPACFLCESSEDFVGRVARLTRRCSARATCSRTVQRYLIKVLADWRDLDA